MRVSVHLRGSSKTRASFTYHLVCVISYRCWIVGCNYVRITGRWCCRGGVSKREVRERRITRVLKKGKMIFDGSKLSQYEDVDYVRGKGTLEASGVIRFD